MWLVNVVKYVCLKCYRKYDKCTRQFRAMSNDVKDKHRQGMLLIGTFSEISSKPHNRHLPVLLDIS